MSTLYPGAIDTFVVPGGSEKLGLSTPTHTESHEDLGDAIVAVEARVGSTGSTDPASVEKRLTDVINASAAAAADAISALAAAALVASDLSTLDSSLGTAAYEDVGTSAGNVVQLDGSARLPAVDGSQLTNLPAVVTDHGALTGLADDDHTQYHTDARGDARYAPLAKGVTNGDSHDHNGGDGAQIAYANLSGLPSLGTAAAANTGDFESAGAVSTHNAVTTAHGISSFGSTLVDDADAATARATLGVPSGSGTSTGTNTGDSATPAETTTSIGALINGATSKTTPVDADAFSIWDSVSGLLQKVTWANVKTTLSSIFVLLAGKSGGQTIIGGTGSAENLTLQSTSHATKGKIYLGTTLTSMYDEASDRLGIGVAPGVTLEVNGIARISSASADAAQKLMYLLCRHYNTVSGSVSALILNSAVSTSTLSLGGGSGSYRAVTGIDFYTAADNVTLTGTKVLSIGTAGNLAIGSHSALARIHAISTTEQLRLGYDASNYTSFTVNSSGTMTISSPLVLSPAASATPPSNNQLVIERTSNTQLTFKLKGSDGTVRSASLTLA